MVYLSLYTLFYGSSTPPLRPNAPRPVPFALPCAPKQSGNLTLGLGSESIGYLVSKIGGTSSALWRKDCFPTSVQLVSKSKNGRFSALLGPALMGVNGNQ